MDKQYIVVTPLKRGTDKMGEFETVKPGKAVTLPEEEGEKLVEVGALKVPDVVEGEAPAKKK